MQRREGLKRSGLERRSELKADVERVREFMRKRGGFQRKPKPLRQPEGPLSPTEWRRAAFKASEGRCIITGAKAANVEDRRFHAHHVVPRRVLRAHGLGAFVWDPQNAVWLHRDVHLRGLGREPAIPRGVLPHTVWEFCGELDALEGTEWATTLVRRLYPITPSSR